MVFVCVCFRPGLYLIVAELLVFIYSQKNEYSYFGLQEIYVYEYFVFAQDVFKTACKIHRASIKFLDM